MFGNTEHEDIDMDQLYDDFIKKTKEMGPIVVNNNDIDWDVVCRYLITEASKDETCFEDIVYQIVTSLTELYIRRIVTL